MNDFLEELSEILEVEKELLKGDFQYQDVEAWDSLAQLSIITLFMDSYNVKVTQEQILELKTVSELMNLIPA